MTKYNWQKNITEELLENDSILYKIEDNSIPIIYFKLVLEDGALTENDSNRGITSLLSQMLLNGNNKFPQDEVNLELDMLGASLSVASGYDYFALISRVPSNNFVKFIDFLEKMLFGEIEFDDEKFEISKSKAKDLLVRIREDDSYLSSMIFSNIIFKNKNYGLLSSGNTKSLNLLKIGDLKERLEYLKKSRHYSLIAGDYNDKDISKLKSFTNSFKTENVKVIESIDLHKSNGFELYYYQKNNKNKVNVVIGAPSVLLTNKDVNFVLIFNKYFGSDFTSILAQEIRENNGWSYYANSEFSLYKNATLFSMEYAPNIENLLISIDYLKRLLLSNINNIDQDHLEFTKNKIMNSYNFKFSTTVKKLSLLSDLKLYDYPNNFFENYARDVLNVDNEILSSKIKKLINPENQLVVMVGDIEGKISELENSNIFTKIVKLENLDYLN
jgi:zinc protease